MSAQIRIIANKERAIEIYNAFKRGVQESEIGVPSKFKLFPTRKRMGDTPNKIMLYFSIKDLRK